MLQAEAAELRAKVEKRNREVRELNQMLKAWEAMRHSKDRQIEQLVERCRKFEEEAAEKSRAVDAAAAAGEGPAGSVTGTPTSMTRSVGRSGSGVGSVSFGGNHSRGVGWTTAKETAEGAAARRGSGRRRGARRATTRSSRSAAGTPSRERRGAAGDRRRSIRRTRRAFTSGRRARRRSGGGGVADALGDEIVRRRRRERRRRAGVCGKVGTRGGGRGGVARAKRAQVAHPAAQQVGGRQERRARRGDWATRGDETAHEPRVLARW